MLASLSLRGDKVRDACVVILTWRQGARCLCRYPYGDKVRDACVVILTWRQGANCLCRYPNVATRCEMLVSLSLRGDKVRGEVYLLAWYPYGYATRTLTLRVCYLHASRILPAPYLHATRTLPARYAHATRTPRANWADVSLLALLPDQRQGVRQGLTVRLVPTCNARALRAYYPYPHVTRTAASHRPRLPF